MKFKMFYILCLVILLSLSCLPHENIIEYDDNVRNYGYVRDNYVKEYYVSNDEGSCCLIIELNRLAKYSAHTLEDSHRLYIDLMNTIINSTEQSVKINEGVIKCIHTGQYNNDVARITVDTNEKVSYKIQTDSVLNRILVYLYSDRAKKNRDIDQHKSYLTLINQKQKFNNYFDLVQNNVPTLAQELGLKVKTIIIDPGHGGNDPGAVSPHGIKEKLVTLDIAKKLKQLLLEDGHYKVMLTRENDTFIPLEERTAFANRYEGDLFISIHANAHKYSDRNGIETYYLSLAEDEDARAIAAYENKTAKTSYSDMENLLSSIMKNTKIEESRHFAECLQFSLIKKTHQMNRGVKKAGFVVLIGANMPSVLTEIGFLTNPKGEKLLTNNFYRKVIAESIYHGIKEYTNQLLAMSENNNLD